MSDEFLKVATREINQELSAISQILGSCQNNSDVSKNSGEIEAHMHKIKGLAPMMGKETVGELAKTLDIILKKIVAGQNVPNFFESLSLSVDEMKVAMEKPHALGKIQKDISDIAEKTSD
ncbi:MAG: Hpt domain-containing protein [Nitrosopumilaceae archaeon]|jgi:HPt (histidine-containing phosphotransfer) domain-containing protein